MRSSPQIVEGSLEDLPLWSSYTEKLRGDCACKDCYNRATRAEAPKSHQNCKVDALRNTASSVCMYVMGLALFEEFCLDGLKVHSSGMARIKQTTWENLQAILADKNVNSGELLYSARPTELHEVAQKILGYYGGGGSYLALSSYGQVAYFSFLEDSTIRKTSLSRLICLPGTLRYQDDDVFVVRPPVFQVGTYIQHTAPVLGSLNLSPRAELKWYVERALKTLRLAASLADPETSTSPAMADVSKISTGSHEGLFVDDCPHDSDAKLEKPDKFAFFVTRGFIKPGVMPADGTVQIAAVAGDEKQRFWAFALASGMGFRTVYRGNACLACSLRVCREARISVLIA